MSELATVGPELLSELLSDAPEALRLVTHRRGASDTTGIYAIPGEMKFGEADGEAVKVTDSVWLIFSHQLPTKPHADDWIIDADGVKHFVLRAKAEDPANILWRVITRS